MPRHEFSELLLATHGNDSHVWGDGGPQARLARILEDVRADTRVTATPSRMQHTLLAGQTAI